ncbi:MAG: hypothetical protein R3345_10045, partial [Fulvivirga sp.]|nr:hypothetical protein [Fulvivirga sp.]
MKKMFHFLGINYRFLFLIFLLSYLTVVGGRLTAGQSLHKVFLPDGPVAVFFSALIIILLIRLTIKQFGPRTARA